VKIREIREIRGSLKKQIIILYQNGLL